MRQFDGVRIGADGACARLDGCASTSIDERAIAGGSRGIACGVNACEPSGHGCACGGSRETGWKELVVDNGEWLGRALASPVPPPRRTRDRGHPLFCWQCLTRSSRRSFFFPTHRTMRLCDEWGTRLFCGNWAERLSVVAKWTVLPTRHTLPVCSHRCSAGNPVRGHIRWPADWPISPAVRCW